MSDLATGKGGYRPPRGYSWRTAWPGNDLAVTHGARSERLINADAQELVTQATAVIPWLAQPEYEASVRAWARAEAVVNRLASWLAEVGILDDEGKPRHALQELGRFERQAAERRADLGLTPASRARIERDLSSSVHSRVSSLADAMKEGRQIRLEAEGRLASEARS